ncbi:ATP-binding protein [Prevotella melaninogenica]|uniref:ATP-binding protein n=1 Tax=Prevotella melaninogenica TaxID=28132 RepID=A0ABX7XT87_9BACT|nr:AAA family ATPase [Prevotella melaninogenica]QUB76699.1 ATP-binding protein [Prevotella melaninogenica]
MATIQIKNLGPIKDTGLINLTDVLLVIGRQSSGKSTFMKVLCFCRWIEKKIMTSFDNTIQAYTHNKRFTRDLKQFHRIDEIYFKEDTEIIYDGDVVTISLTGVDQNAKINRKLEAWEDRYNSKLSYIPAERNLVSAVQNINDTYKAKERDSIFNFIQEWYEAKDTYGSDNKLPLSLTDDFKYYSDKGLDYVVLPNGKPITSFYASSGVQSIMPIDVMTDYIMGVVGKVVKFSMLDLMNRLMESLDTDVRNEIVHGAHEVTEEELAPIREKMKYQSAQLFIEEPEQNLYPDAQRKLVQNIIRHLKAVKSVGKHRSMVVLTTHSPYVLSILNVLIADAAAVEKKPGNERLKDVVDESTLLPTDAFSAYFINKDGVFEDIKDMEIPMLSGINLDSVSDWVDEHVDRINEILYAE